MSWAILTPSYYEPALAVAPAPDSAVDPSSAASPAWLSHVVTWWVTQRTGKSTLEDVGGRLCTVVHASLVQRGAREASACMHSAETCAGTTSPQYKRDNILITADLSVLDCKFKQLHVDAREFERIKDMVPPNVGLWINATEDEVFYGRGAGHLASCRNMSLSVSSELVALDERSGMSVGADSEETKGPLGKTAQFDESDEKKTWTRMWLPYTRSPYRPLWIRPAGTGCHL
ncbi:hypothetical protein BJV77DRAFT_958637 [Russula vinacea]|nr:hypothetical protein BJV77DRAFT_958637 [Russula vinacea]